jgi:peptide deformylase
MIYPIVLYGHPVLRQPTKDVERSTDTKELIQDMFETMKQAQGIGLAAPQIGKSLRLFVVDGTILEDEPAMQDFRKVFINPVVIEELGEVWEYEEGCLSIPNIRENVARREKLRIRYYDEDWNLREEDYYGLKARIIQHEYDHIEGRLFIDYLTPLKKRLLKSKLADISRGKVETEYRIKHKV